MLIKVSKIKYIPIAFQPNSRYHCHRHYDTKSFQSNISIRLLFDACSINL
jgi:hypothetical protein